MRAYTIREIDALRRVVENKYLHGSYVQPPGWSRPYREEEKLRAVEDAVRSHMLSGHTAEDLLALPPPPDVSS